MHLHYQTYGIVSRQTTPEAHSLQERLQTHLRAEHPELSLVPSYEAELLLVLGGDGTLLETLRDERTSQADLIALNTGHVGFLSTDREASRFIETIEEGLTGKLVRMPVPVMEITHRSDELFVTYRAVNDLLIERTMTWITFHVEQVIANSRAHFLKEVRGSGLCICSAIGSTSPMAAHLQAPRIDPALSAFYLKGINDARPPTNGLLVSAATDRCLRLTISTVEPNLGIPPEHRLPPALYLDGIHVALLKIGDVIDVRYSARAATLLRRPDELHHDRVRQLVQ